MIRHKLHTCSTKEHRFLRTSLGRLILGLMLSLFAGIVDSYSQTAEFSRVGLRGYAEVGAFLVRQDAVERFPVANVGIQQDWDRFHLGVESTIFSSKPCPCPPDRHCPDLESTICQLLAVSGKAGLNVRIERRLQLQPSMHLGLVHIEHRVNDQNTIAPSASTPLFIAGGATTSFWPWPKKHRRLGVQVSCKVISVLSDQDIRRSPFVILSGGLTYKLRN